MLQTPWEFPVRPGPPSPQATVLWIGHRIMWRPAMVRIDVTTMISRPVQEVWDFFIDLTNSPQWTRSGSELRKTSEGPFGVGTTVESVKPMFGREIRSQRLVATRFEPPYLVSFTAELPVIGQLVGGFTLEDIGAETRLSRWTEVNVGGLRGVLGSGLAPIVRRTQGTELRNLKRLIEARPDSALPSTSARRSRDQFAKPPSDA
jgi:uncharacterized protein YndB with AHSA1/START domain